MFELAALLGISAKLNKTAFLNPDRRKNFQNFAKYFPRFAPRPLNFVIPSKVVKFEKGSKHYEDPLGYCSEEFLRNESLTFDGEFFQSWKYFHHIFDKIKEAFRFSQTDINSARKMVANVRLNTYFE